jgi:hypothetical protein
MAAVVARVLFAFLLGLAAGPQVPAANDVAGALARAYGGAVTAQTGRQPSFIVGDFNWDGSEDLAAVVAPVDGRLDAINSEIANWILEDPSKVRILDFLPRRVGPAPSTRAVVHKDDTLLAIIHGEGPRGWRAPQASHFLLVADRGATNLKLWSKKDFYASIRNAPRPIRSVRGDVIGETRAGASGFLLYAGGKYAWYDPSAPK